MHVMRKTFIKRISIRLHRPGFLLFFCCYFFCSGISQSTKTDSLKQTSQSGAVTTEADQLNALSKKYWLKNLDSSVYYAQKALQLSQKLDYKRGMAESYRNRA